MKRSVVILTGSHLCHNPRVIKEATTLTEAGWAVEILGGWLDSTLKQRDRELSAKLQLKFVPVFDLTEQTSAKRLFYRVRNKLAGIAHGKFGCENRWQLGHAAEALRSAALRRRADLVIAHSEQALWAAAQLPDSNFALGVDMEDWFSEDLSPEARKGRPIGLLRSLETRLLRKGAYSSCTSRAMSDALALEYDCRPPAVVYNAFPWADRQKRDDQLRDRKNRSLPSIHWVSQVLGYGRGVEDLVAALPHLKHSVEIHLRGEPMDGFDQWLREQLPEPWRDRVFLHGQVSNDELFMRMAEHDIGFAGELPYCRNKDLTVSNKILHYLLAGLAVVASDTAGQREVAQQAPEAVRLYPSGDPQALAAQINALLASPEELRSAKAAALAAAEKTFCWERQAPTLLAHIENALTR